ncbi:hypothetical protein [Rhodococcus jostii]|uniref:Uncharacterized protein n=1 Tax=Rhodococcus jostii TaxID=132919 RepID=A0A1H4R3G3_RHOJO|nr:hypothetical protein [Rhodococcus jostii]SEC26469.1 hypothetical protein SAMN04490220_1200 [Rhodococcus jostii]
MSNTAVVEESGELTAPRARYRASIGGDSHEEFVAARITLVEVGTGQKVSEEDVDYL